jgi:hypothetical protein
VKIEIHQAKAERIERSLAKCSASDYETVIEGAMLAGTHWLNVLLHCAGFRDVENDVVHAEFVSLGERCKLSVALPEALKTLDEIERLRTTHVRGDMLDGERAAEFALECLARLRESAHWKPAVP